MGVKGLLTYIKHRINWEDERRASVGEYGKSSLPPSLPSSPPSPPRQARHSDTHITLLPKTNKMISSPTPPSLPPSLPQTMAGKASQANLS